MSCLVINTGLEESHRSAIADQVGVGLMANSAATAWPPGGGGDAGQHALEGGSLDRRSLGAGGGGDTFGVTVLPRPGVWRPSWPECRETLTRTRQGRVKGEHQPRFPARAPPGVQPVQFRRRMRFCADAARTCEGCHQSDLYWPRTVASKG